MIIGNFEISLFAFRENRTNVVQIVGDHAQADPSLHSAISPVEAAPKTMSALQNTDASLTTGSPFLSGFEPALLLLALSLGAFCVATRDTYALDASVMRRSFVLSGVECGVARHQAGSTALSVLMHI